MKGFKVVVGDKRPKSGKDLEGKDYKVCGQYKKKIRNGRRVTVKCKKQPSGKFVFVYLPREGVLKICKARIYKRTKPPGKPVQPPVTPVIEPPPVKPPVEPPVTPVIEPPPVIKPTAKPPVQPPVKPGEPEGNFST